MKSGSLQISWGIEVPVREKGLGPSYICILVTGMSVTQHKRGSPAWIGRKNTSGNPPQMTTYWESHPSLWYLCGCQYENTDAGHLMALLHLVYVSITLALNIYVGRFLIKRRLITCECRWGHCYHSLCVPRISRPNDISNGGSCPANSNTIVLRECKPLAQVTMV